MTPNQASVNRDTNKWRTGDRQPRESEMRGRWYLQVRYSPYKGARGDKK